MTGVHILQTSRWESAPVFWSSGGLLCWWPPLDLMIDLTAQQVSSWDKLSDVTSEHRTSEAEKDCKDLQRGYMNERVSFSNLGQKQPTQPNFSSLILFIQPKGFSDNLRGRPSWVSVHFTRSPISHNAFYCKHFGSVPPAPCCFSWPSGCLQVLCKLLF